MDDVIKNLILVIRATGEANIQILSLGVTPDNP